MVLTKGILNFLMLIELMFILRNGPNRENPEIFWLDDRYEGRLRVAVTTDGVNSSLYGIRKATISELNYHQFPRYHVSLQFTYDNQRLYVSSNLGRDKQAI